MLYTQSLQPSPSWHVPDKEECFALWDEYEMLDNIREHCSLVAKTALLLVENLPTYAFSAFQNLQKNNLLPQKEVSENIIIPKVYIENLLKAEPTELASLAEAKAKITLDFLDTGLTRKAIVAAALLHDIAKTYTIKHGGDHAMLGAAFVREKTGNPYLANAVYAHISWHWANHAPLSEQTLAHVRLHAGNETKTFVSQVNHKFEQNPITMPLLISYADKRVTHSNIVTLDGRFENLFERYGKSEKSRARIQENYNQAKYLEQCFCDFGMDIHCTKEAVMAIDL